MWGYADDVVVIGSSIGVCEERGEGCFMDGERPGDGEKCDEGDGGAP